MNILEYIRPVPPDVESILAGEFRGVWYGTGSRGIGKSYFVSQVEDPALILYLDYEDKGEGIDTQLEFGGYFSVTEMAAGEGPLGLFNRTVEIIRGIPQNRFTVAIIDNVSPLELALNAEAARDMRRYARDFSLNLKNIESGTFGGLKPVVNYLITEMICAPLHAKGIKLVCATAHMKPPWVKGPVPNKLQAKGADRWQDLSILSLILVPGEYRPVPAAIVQKEQLGQITYNRKTREHDIVRRLPLRMPRATVREVKHYLINPANLENPQPGEVPSQDEIDMYGEKLSREQIALIMEIARSEREEATAGSLVAAQELPLAQIQARDDTLLSIRKVLTENPQATDEEIVAQVSTATGPLIWKAKKAA